MTLDFLVFGMIFCGFVLIALSMTGVLSFAVLVLSTHVNHASERDTEVMESYLILSMIFAIIGIFVVTAGLRLN